MRIKIILSISILVSFVCCRNNSTEQFTNVPLTNCEGLLTDTAGTNDNGRIFMPSAFTSNGDSKNDIIKPSTINISSITFTIYDINNNIKFTTTQLGQGWSAPALPNGSYSTYYYKIQAVTNANKKMGICGEVNNLTCYPSTIPKEKIFFEDQLRIDGFTGVTTEVLQNCN